MRNLTGWPIKAKEELAFAPGRAATAVPIYPGETSLTWDEYLDRFRLRLQWMQDNDPEEVPRLYSRKWWELAGRDVDLKNIADHVQSLVFLEDFLAENEVHRGDFPMKVESQERAVDAMWAGVDGMLNMGL